MSAKIDEAKNDADKFAGMVLHYSHNAEKYLKEKDFHKASEMMWGAMSCALKAVAAKKKLSIKSHKELGTFAIKLSKESKEREIFNSYSKASMLHKHFYESDLDEYLVRGISKNIAKTIGKLMKEIGYKAP